MRPTMNLISTRYLLGIICLAFCAACGDGLGTAPCGFGLTTDGGAFTPTTCELQIVVPGVPCEAGPCPPDHVLALTDNNRTHINQVALFHFVEYTARSFTFDPAQDLREVQ